MSTVIFQHSVAPESPSYDAYVLAELLGDSRVRTAQNVVAALKAYDEIRRPRSQSVVTSSKENAYLLCLHLDRVGDDETKLKETWQSRLRWIWDLDTEEQAERTRQCMFKIWRVG
jgi:salicylate hydroxylase